MGPCTKWRIALLSICLALVATAGGCREAELKSVWRGQEIAIDGLRADWQGIDVYNFDDSQVLLGVANDSASIYLLLITSSRILGMQALTAGLTTSLSVEEHPSEALTLCYALQPRGGPGGPGPGREEGEQRDGAREDSGTPPGRHAGVRGGGFGGEEGIRQILEGPPGQIVIFGLAGKDTLRLDPAEAAKYGIEEKAGYKDGYFVIELKAPLRRDAAHAHAIGAAPEASGPSAKAQLVDLALSIPRRKGGSSAPEGFSGGRGRMEPPDDGDEDPDESGFPGRGDRGDRPGGGPRERRSSSAPASLANGLDLKARIALEADPEPQVGR